MVLPSKTIFEDWCKKMCGAGNFTPKLVLQVLPKLLNSTVVTFMNGTTHTSERALHGYFAFHRLFLWAVAEYKDLSADITKKVKVFVQDPNERLKKVTPNVGEWLAYLTVITVTWEQVSQSYLQETFERNVMWYLKENSSLSNPNTPVETRLSETFRLTQVSRDLCAFQVLFLDIAKPKTMTLEEVTKRYDENCGLPTAAMESEMKEAVKKIKATKNYNDWFNVIKIPTPSKQGLSDILAKSVECASTKDGYYQKGGGGGRGGGGGGGRGGGRGGRGGGGRGNRY